MTRPTSRAHCGPRRSIRLGALALAAATMLTACERQVIEFVDDPADAATAPGATAPDASAPATGATASGPEATSSPQPTRDVPVPDDVFIVEVDFVIDGDTLAVTVREPFDTEGLSAGDRLRVRLLRIDTPEVGRDGEPSECLAEEATDHLEGLAPEGTILRLAHDVEAVDQYGRDLVHAWTPGDRWINGSLVEAGLARVVTFRPNTGYDDEIRERQQRAQDARVGLWDPMRCPA